MSDNPEQQRPAAQRHERERERDHERHAEIIDRWWEECIKGSAIGRNVDTWNDAMKAREELKRRLGRG